MGIISSHNYPGAMALESLHTISNSSNVKVYLDIPTRMTGATLPLCSRQGWTYVKSENETLLESTDYWKDVDYAIVGSLSCAPCKRGKGIEGKGEWEVIYRQKGFEGIEWRRLEVPDFVWNNSYVHELSEGTERVKWVVGGIQERIVNGVQENAYWNKVASHHHFKGVLGKTQDLYHKNRHAVLQNVEKIISNPYLQNYRQKSGDLVQHVSNVIQSNVYVQRMISNDHVLKLRHMCGEMIDGGIRIPWPNLEDKIFVLKHMRDKDFIERNNLLEEKKEKERQGLGKAGEVEGQWRDFY